MRNQVYQIDQPQPYRADDAPLAPASSAAATVEEPANRDYYAAAAHRNGKISDRAIANIQRGFSEQKVVILGIARQGRSLARFFAQAGARVVVSDANTAENLQEELHDLEGLPIEYVLGGHPDSLLDGCNLLCLSGGVPPQLPIVQDAIGRKIPLTNDSLLTLQTAGAGRLGPTVAITGSSGKTTTTTLVGEMLAARARRVHVGGNIGTPLLDRLNCVDLGEPIVLELSSFQLELYDPDIAWGAFETIGPDVAAILNITPNHLDRHPNMKSYAAAKLNLVRYMQPGATVVLNLDDAVTASLLPEHQGHRSPALPPDWRLDELLYGARSHLQLNGVKTVPYSIHRRLKTGAWLEDGYLVVEGERVCHRSDVHLRGDHNLSNLLAAFAISHAAGTEIDSMHDIATNFRGVAHRLEIVAQENGITWINDSIATSPERALAGLRSFAPENQTIILLAGGKDKNLPWGDLANEVVTRVNFLIGFGQHGAKIVEQVQESGRFMQKKAPNCAVVRRLDEAVQLASRIAGPASVVLLSPGGASFDAYRNFEERGEHFRKLVQQVLAGKMASSVNGTH